MTLGHASDWAEVPGYLPVNARRRARPVIAADWEAQIVCRVAKTVTNK